MHGVTLLLTADDEFGREVKVTVLLPDNYYYTRAHFNSIFSDIVPFVCVCVWHRGKELHFAGRARAWALF